MATAFENLGKPLRDLKLQIEGTQLEPIVRQFEQELQAAGIRRLRPKLYLSTEWGVPEGTIAIGIPFYLASPELAALHAERAGFVEGTSPASILRYLRHEMGHVVNYAYLLYEDPAWVELFGSITQPYLTDYRPQPFSRRYVVHLPGWYAQMHPDEDWSETFAVWMTPGRDWRAEHADWPEALKKLRYCDRKIREIGEQDPVVTRAEVDEDVSQMSLTLDDLYQVSAEDERFPPGLDGALRTIFEDYQQPDAGSTAPRQPAGRLIRRLERDLMANVFRWTGHFPERTQVLLRHLAARAEFLGQVYPADREQEAVVAFTVLAASLAMNHVYRGSYLSGDP